MPDHHKNYSCNVIITQLDSCPKKKNPTIEAHLAHIIGSLLSSFFMSKKPKVHKNQITSPIVIGKPLVLKILNCPFMRMDLFGHKQLSNIC